jgi:hypothetical protein
VPFDIDVPLNNASNLRFTLDIGQIVFVLGRTVPASLASFKGSIHSTVIGLEGYRHIDRRGFRRMQSLCQPETESYLNLTWLLKTLPLTLGGWIIIPSNEPILQSMT